MTISETVFGTFVGILSVDITQAELNIWNNDLQAKYSDAPMLTRDNLKNLLYDENLKVTSKEDSRQKYLKDILSDMVNDLLYSQPIEIIDRDINYGDGLEIN